MNRALLFMIAMGVLLLSCSDAQSKLTTPIIPGIDVEPENWNTSMKLIDDPILSNSYKNGKLFTLRVENLSKTAITSSNNFEVKVITLDGQNWIDVPNNFYNAGPDYLPTKESYPLGLLVTILPYIPNLSSSINIRIVIIGHAEDNDKELLGAYYDVVLNP